MLKSHVIKSVAQVGGTCGYQGKTKTFYIKGINTMFQRWALYNKLAYVFATFKIKFQ